MKIKQLLTKTLLVAVCLLVGQSAWGTKISKTISSWNFNNYGTTTWLSIDNTASSISVLSKDVYPCNDAKYSGLYLEGTSESSDSKFRIDKSNGVRAYTSGGNVLCVPSLKKGDKIEIVGFIYNNNGTKDVVMEVSDNADLVRNSATSFSITMNDDGNLGIKSRYYNDDANAYYSVASIAVTREVEAIEVNSWMFKSLSWSSETGYGTSTVTINNQNCTYATGALEGLALQSANTNWQVNNNYGLLEGNGNRNVAILNLKANDYVEIVTSTTLTNDKIVNGSSFNDTYTGTCIFTVSADGAFGFETSRWANSTGAFTSIKVYRSLSSAVEEYNNVKEIAETLRDVPNDNSIANSTLSSVITAQNAVVASATMYAQITSAISTLNSAIMTYIAAANPTSGNKFDLTFLFTNPNFDNITNNGDAAAQGWFTDIPRTDLGTYNNFQVRTSLLDGKNAVERFTSNVCTTPNTYALYQKINLPAGRYSFSTEAMANQPSSIVMAVGDTEGEAITNANSFVPYNMDFENVAEAELKVGIKISSEGTNACYWMALTNLKLYKEAASYVSVTIASSGYSSLGSAYGLDFANATTSTNGAAALTAFAAAESSETSVKLVSIDEAPAATGVILKGTPGATYTIPVKANAAALTVTNLLHAAVAATDIEGNTSYIMQGGQFHLVTADSTVPAGKAYLQAAATGGAKALTVVFADDLTGVANVNAAEAVQPVKRIVNGQLVIEKNGKRFNAAGAEF